MSGAGLEASGAVRGRTGLLRITALGLATVLTAGHASAVVMAKTFTVEKIEVVGAYKFGSFYKGKVIPLPQEYRHPDRLNATHLLIPADCRIDDQHNRTFVLIRYAPAAQDRTLVDETGQFCVKIEPGMYEGVLWDAYRAIVNLFRGFFGLPPITAQSMFNDLVTGHNIPQAEREKGWWWETPAYSAVGSHEFFIADAQGNPVGNQADIIVVIRQPIKIETRVPDTGNVRRFERFEAEITLDDEYFHHLGTDAKGVTQQDRFDAYDADHDGERIRVDARFRLMDGDQVVEDHDYVVPCFPMKESATGSFKWKVRFSPPRETTVSRMWVLTVQAAVWHQADPDTPGNYNELNPHGPEGSYYHCYGGVIPDDEGKIPAGHGTNGHLAASNFYMETDPLTGAPYDDDLPIPTVRFACDAAIRPGPLRTAKAGENPRFFYRDFAGGTASSIYLLGLCRFVNLRETDQPLKTFWHSGWINTTDEVLEPLDAILAPDAQGGGNFAGLLSIWSFTPDSSLVHTKRGGEYSEEWYGFASANRDTATKVSMPAEMDVCMYFDQGRADMLDRLLEAAEAKDVLLMVTVWGHGDLRHPQSDGGSWPLGQWGPFGENGTNPWWRVSPQVADFVGASSGTVWEHQANYYRYLIGRYGSDPALGLWEAVSEYPGIQGAGVTNTKRQGFMNRVRDFFRSTDPYGHPISSSSQGWGTPTYTSGDYASTHAYGQVVGTTGINWPQQLSLPNDAAFRQGVLNIANVLPSQAPATQPWIHGEVGAQERSSGSAGPPEVPAVDVQIVTTPPHIFKGITTYHYTMMSDLMRGAAGTPLKWNDAKEFGEMKARAALAGSQEYCPYFNSTNYGPHYFNVLQGHRSIVQTLIDSGLAPWSATGSGSLPDVNGTAGLWTRNSSVASCWIYKTTDAALSLAGKVCDLSTVVSPGGTSYELVWINPWDGSRTTPAVETLPAADPGGGNPWIGAVDIWTNKMGAVNPTGFDERSQEDVLVVIEKK